MIFWEFSENTGIWGFVLQHGAKILNTEASSKTRDSCYNTGNGNTEDWEEIVNEIIK